MFNVGDLVTLKKKGIAKTRYHPDKKIGIVREVRREVFYTYTGELDDAITVYWMPLDTHETVMEFYLEFAEKLC
tara:strand:+ start:381 stop:602 length:222 start_codon:yes stop_codon:yes gene_type:complete